ncbi:hypothetical protein K469DRAFT_705641 [Zopfia rhizophila CBS 207.26]|uniref:Uncharacterized protein n=1 Tax=Zopfia rhizophila CBS 207.26 TaxID=1314779 RepID=A0A6A6E7D7_9PEZI|nr:hypothetical protein K469DRAFT_705641 [Zopfia rhizophila CBS 207.26]
MDKNSFDEDDMEGLSPDDTSPSESQEDQEVPPPGASPIASSSNPRKRRASAEPSAQPNSKKGFKRDFLRYCCQCLNGPWLHNTYSDCMNCSHRLCNGCTQNVNVHDEEGMGLGMEFAHQMGV